MDIKWKDGEGNILNASNEKIIYLNAKENKKTTIEKDEIKKITIEDRLMNVFKDFQNELIISIVIPKKHRKDAVKIFNEFDKTGTILKGKSNHTFLNLILESSLAFGTPFLGMGAIVLSALFVYRVIEHFAEPLFGDLWIILIRLIVFGYPVYLVLSYIVTKIKRKNIKET